MPLDYEDVLGIKEAIAEGLPQTAIAQRFFLDPSTVSKICRGHLYPEVPWPSGETGGLDPVEYRRIRFERKQSEAAAPLNESPLKSHLATEEVTAIEGASRLLDEIGHLFSDEEYEFDSPVGEPDVEGNSELVEDQQLDVVQQLDKARQEKLKSLRKQRAALDELGEAAAKRLDWEINEVVGMAHGGIAPDSRAKPSGLLLDGWDWDEVLANASSVEIVQLIIAQPEEFPNLVAAQRAVGVVLKAMPERQWQSKIAIDLIAGLTKEIAVSELTVVGRDMEEAPLGQKNLSN